MKFIPNGVSTRVARVALSAQKASPQTLLVGGLVGMGTTVVLACRATLQVERILDEHDEKMAKIEKGLQIEVLEKKYGDTQARRDRTVVYLQTTVELGKVYGPAIVVGTASICALIGAHNILNRRNAALAAAYTTVQKSFENEVLDNLGIERCPAGAVTGWIKDEGDSYIDFGIFTDENSERVIDFMVGREKSIWLDFNVDGTIYDKI
jgi:hypothetical protein